MQDGLLDCLVVGAGPAGLSATTHLIRFHRRIAVLDAGESRARWIPTSHNCPGFPFGIAGTSLLERLREQAGSYGASITPGRVTAPERDGEVFVDTAQDGRQWRARQVLIATGIVDRMPQMVGLEHAIDAGTVRLCAVCDGYEASDERIGVFSPESDAIRHVDADMQTSIDGLYAIGDVVSALNRSASQSATPRLPPALSTTACRPVAVRTRAVSQGQRALSGRRVRSRSGERAQARYLPVHITRLLTRP